MTHYSHTSSQSIPELHIVLEQGIRRAQHTVVKAKRAQRRRLLLSLVSGAVALTAVLLSGRHLTDLSQRVSHAQATAAVLQTQGPRQAATLMAVQLNDRQAQLADLQTQQAVLVPTLTQVALEQNILLAYVVPGQDVSTSAFMNGQNLTKLVIAYPENPVAWMTRGLDDLQDENYQAARNAFSRAIELDPSNAIAYYNRAIADVALQDYTTTILDLNEAIRLNPSFKEAYLMRGDANRELGLYDQAIADYTQAANLGGLTATWLLKRGTGQQ